MKMATTPSEVAACRGCLATQGLSLLEGGLEDCFVQLAGVTLTTAKITSIDRQLHKLTLNLSQSPIYTFTSEENESISPETSIKNEIKDEDDTPVDSPHCVPYDTDIDDVDDDIQTKEKDEKIAQIEGSTAIAGATKSAKNKLGNTEILRFKRSKRRKIGDDFYPQFDYEKFEKECKVKIKLLSKEEQKQELEDRKTTSNYLRCPFRCETCGKGFNYEKPLRNHMSYHDPELGPFECDICHFRFRSNRKRLKHVDLHRVKFTCCECGVVTRDRDSARRHCAEHAGAKYPCRHCEAVFQRKSSYFNHMRERHPTQNVACEQCGETFLSARGVMQHKARAHRPNVKPEDYKCPTCDVAFSSLYALERHSAAAEHSAHPCPECGEACASEELLRAHVEGHGQHRCEECDVSFTSAAAFDMHHRRKHLDMRSAVRARERRLRVRTAPRRGVCDLCGLLVQNETALKYHQLIHQAVKPYACPHCPKTFAAKHARDWHTRTHTGERPFPCDQCAHTFSLRGNLQRHRRVVHQGIRKSVPCSVCGKIFTTNASVRLHINTVHRRMPAPKRKRTKKKQESGGENK